jgi:hypothetical protein
VQIYKEKIMNTKSWYKSKGVDGSLIGIITMVVLLAMKAFGLDADTEQTNITEIVTATIALIGMIIALIGRLRATTKITK